MTLGSAGVTKVTNVTSGWVLSSLINGAYYSFIVTAVDANGEGQGSAVATTQPHN